MTFMANAKTTPMVLAGDYNEDIKKLDRFASEEGYKRSDLPTRFNKRLDCIYANGTVLKERTYRRGTSDHVLLEVELLWDKETMDRTKEFNRIPQYDRKRILEDLKSGQIRLQGSDFPFKPLSTLLKDRKYINKK
jgi:hypothetical protein